MAVVRWSPGIDSVSGALSKAKKKDGHSCGEYLIGTHRTAETTSADCNRLYIRTAESYVRSTAPSVDEIKQRNKFATVSRAVAERMQDLSQISADQAAFKAQKDEPGGKKTFKSYLWKLELEAYED